MNYTVYYELGVGSEVIKDTMTVDAVDEEHAVDFAGKVLDQEHNQGENQNNVVLLVCEVVE